MATRSIIIVKVRPSDIGQDKKFSKEILGDVYNSIPDDAFSPIHIINEYLSIYCHFDGYVNGGVGEALKTSFNTYDKALNLILGGDCSGINSDAIYQYGEEDCDGPDQDYSLKELMERRAEDYNYLFTEEDGWRLVKSPEEIVDYEI